MSLRCRFGETQQKKTAVIPTHGREDVGVVAADGVGPAAVNRLGLKLLGLRVEVGGAVLLPLLLTVAVVPLTDSHHLHPPLLPADDDYGEEERGDGEEARRSLSGGDAGLDSAENAHLLYGNILQLSPSTG